MEAMGGSSSSLVGTNGAMENAPSINIYPS